MSRKYIESFQKGLDEILKIDPTLEEITKNHEFPSFYEPESESTKSSFEYLVRSIVSQQISGAASAKIMHRFISLCNEGDQSEDGSTTNEKKKEDEPQSTSELPKWREQGFPDAKTVSELDIDTLREIGFSLRKAEYVTGLAKLYQSGELSDDVFLRATNEEAFDKIVSVRGLGPWTAEMFLIFYLHRLDVFSVTDIGVQRGMKKYLEMRNETLRLQISKNKKDYTHMNEVASKFEPYRSVFQMVLWKISDIQMNTVEARDEEVKKQLKQSSKKVKRQ